MTLNVSGLASGLDINSIIESLMEVERQPIRRKEVQIERTGAIGEVWREVNSALDTFRRTLLPLKNQLTYTAPVPKSSNEDVLTASVSGMPDKGSYRFNVTQLATNHTVATNPPTAGERISDPNAALGFEGTFHLSTGRPPEGLDSLTFNQADTDWLRGNFGAGFQAVIDGDETSVYKINPEDLAFAEGYDGEEIKVYMNSFTDLAGEDALEDLEAYFAEKGWTGIELENEPLFVIKHDGTDWVTENQNGDIFAFLGDHPLGKFDLRGEIVGDGGEVIAVNNFDFQIRDTVDDTGFITVKEGDSLLDIADIVNFASVNTGVSANVVKVNEGDYRLVFESLEEGTDGFIQAYDYAPLDDDGKKNFGEDTILANLSMIKGEGNQAAPDYKHVTEEAQNAEFALNGLQLTRSSNTFTDVVDGLELSLEGLGQANLEVAPDIDAAVEEIRLFVEAFNEANAFLRRVQDEEDGPLQGSSDVMRMERQLRTIIHNLIPDVPGSSHLRDSLAYDGTRGISATATGTYTGSAQKIELTYNSGAGTWRHDGRVFQSGDEIHGVTIDIDPAGNPANRDTLVLDVNPPTDELTYNSLSSIGIMASDEKGVLQVDDAKLRAALAEDPEGIFKMFAREAPTDAAGRKTGPDGLGIQMDNLLKRLIGPSGVIDNRQRALQLDIKQFQDRIEMIERRLEMRERRLIGQFTFMEQYIARIQEQTGLMTTFEAMMQGQRD